MARTAHDQLLGVYIEYLSARGYTATKIREGSTKTPDLEVTGRDNVYLNEFKSPELLLDPTLGLYKFATTNSKLLQFIRTAIKQFTAFDPAHNKPWVMTFTSRHMQLNWHSLFEAMQGGSIIDGKVIANWTNTETFRRWQGCRYVVDLYVWLQVSDAGPIEASFFTNDRTPHRTLIDSFVGELRVQPLSAVGHNWLLV
jgi:hypothetical protein